MPTPTPSRPRALPRPLRLFYSYVSADEPYFQELDNHLAPLRQTRILETTFTLRMLPGVNHWAEIHDNLREADLFVPFISSDFFTSSQNLEDDQNVAIQLCQERGTRIIPIWIRPANWANLPFASLQALPLNGVPVARWPSHDAAWAQIADEIGKVAEAMRAGPR
ncbi:MAG: TIR domain-containing protein [Byssovorax sp.]